MNFVLHAAGRLEGALTMGYENFAGYEPPPIDEAVDEELREWIERRKASFPDSNV